MEAWFVTGQAKNLLEFAQRSKNAEDGTRSVALHLVTYERGTGAGEHNNFVTTARENGVPLELLTERGRFDTAVIRQIRDIVEEHDPDIIQTHNVKSHFLMRLTGLWRKRRWVAFHHGYTTPDLKMRVYNQLDRWSLRAAHHVVTVCGKFAQDLREIGVPEDRIMVRHNSVRPFQPPAAAAVGAVRARLPEDTPILLVVGRLSHEKGHADLLDAVHILRQRTKERFHVVFVGDGPEEEGLKAARAKLGLEDVVTLAGLQHDVRPYYAVATAVVMPSHSEGSPNVLLESMAAGVPVVATRVGGIPEIVSDGKTALLVESRDPEAMARAIQRALEDPALRKNLVENARRLAEEKYSPEAYRRSLVKMYEEILATPRYG